MAKNNRVAILGGVRTPFVKANTLFELYSSLDLMKIAIRELVERFGLKGERVGDVALGSVFFHPSTWNFAREATLKSGLAPETPAFGIQRACATSLDAAIAIANKISSGNIEVGIAGGAESMSNVSLFYDPTLSRRIVRTVQGRNVQERLKAWIGFKPKELRPNTPAPVEPTTGKSMGDHCEMMVREWDVSRQEQDELALKSHHNGWHAYGRGFYNDLVVPFSGVQRDSMIRGETTIEKMAKLPAVFDRSSKGTLTAANSSPLTDGSAAVLLSSETWAKKRGIPIQAYLTDYETTAVDFRKEGLLMAPAYAVPPMLQRNDLKLQDFDFYEIHEAFAGQVLCTLRAWESAHFCKKNLGLEDPLGKISREKLNVAGGSVALGHPFGATGARLLATAAKLISEKGKGRALLSICAGGGMGTVAIVEGE